MSDHDWASIDALRQQNIGRLLYRAFRHYHEAALDGVRRRGHRDITLAQSMLLPHVDREGLRLTVIAERAGMTKQSASELVQSLEKLGYLRRDPDASDRRAQRVSFTPRGEQFLRDAFDAKCELARDLETRLGIDGARRLFHLLERYTHDSTESPNH